MLPMHPALAEEHIRDLHAAAERSRLLAIARCCHPAIWQLAARRARAAIRTWARAGQFGPRPDPCACS